MNDEEFGSLKVLKYKYRRGHQIIQLFFKSAWFLPRNQAPSIQAIQLFCKIGFPPYQIGSHLESEAISENWRKVSTLNHVKYII